MPRDKQSEKGGHAGSGKVQQQPKNHVRIWIWVIVFFVGTAIFAYLMN